jgi:hypothetical protein
MALSRSTGIPVRGPKDLPVSRTAVPAVLVADYRGTTGETPVGLMGETPMLPTDGDYHRTAG